MGLIANRHILIVEDSHEDYEATIRAFTKAGLANPIYRCEDGDDALDYLYRRGKYSEYKDSPLPGVILLDLNIPGFDGRDVLKKIKSDPVLKRIPVIVLTTSNDARDINQCYMDGANSYMCKPVGLKGYVEAIERLKGFWFEIAILPAGE